MEQVEPVTLIDGLRSATWHRHEAFERLPFVNAMVEGTLPLESYIAQLRGLAVILSAVEQALIQSRDPQFDGVMPFIKSRFEMLSADLAFFAQRLVPDILPAVRLSLAFAREIRSLPAKSSGRLIGFLYVLQGTTRGNQVHLPDITRCFNLQDAEGVLFYRGFGAATDASWEEFRTIINGTADEIEEQAVSGAIRIYDVLERFHEALYPLHDGNFGFTATALNPEAGDHPVPQNPKILQAALRAGRRCHEEFSYYELRYGERGRRFTDSDAAWLAALADQPVEVVADQVLWLGRVLSARGMPFILLERQLVLLAEELEVGSNTEALQTVIADLRQQRFNTVSQSRFDEVCCSVAKLLSPTSAAKCPDLPLILVAAHADAVAGTPECLSSLISWLKSSSIMTDEELEAVQKFISTEGYLGLGTLAVQEIDRAGLGRQGAEMVTAVLKEGNAKNAVPLFPKVTKKKSNPSVAKRIGISLTISD